MSKVNLYIHIGTFKTGSTALQYYLASKENELAVQQLIYRNWQDDGFSMNHAHIANALAYNDHNTVERFFAELASNCLDRSAHSAVVSAEGFYCPEYTVAMSAGVGLDPDQLLAAREQYVIKLRQAIPDIFRTRIVVYLRRQDYFWESFYNQVVKGVFGYPYPIARLVSEYGCMADYQFMLDIWAEQFGRDNIIVRIYEKDQMPYGIVADFFQQVLGMQAYSYSELHNMTHNRVNASLCRDVLEFKKVINNFTSNLSFEERRLLRDDLSLVSHRLGDYSLYRALLSPAERIDILDRYRDGNRYVAEHYCGKHSGRLFLEPLPDASQFSPYPGLRLDRAIAIAEQLRYIQHQRLQIQVEELKSELSEQHKEIMRLKKILDRNQSDQLFSNISNSEV